MRQVTAHWMAVMMGAMPMFRRNVRERVVDAAEKEGQRHFKRGDLTGAIGQYEEGCRLARQLVADDPANTRIASRLAAMLCACSASGNVPEMRGAPGLRATFAPELAEFLPTFGSELSKVQAGDLPRPARMLLGLEAHAMFAAASRAEVTGLRYRFGDLGPHWARAVLACAGLMNVSAERAGVRDAIGWLTGICRQLEPFTIIDPAARDLVVECLSWSRDIHAEDGDADAVASLDSVLAMLDSVPRVGGETAG